jgi:hypothetical protein
MWKIWENGNRMTVSGFKKGIRQRSGIGERQPSVGEVEVRPNPCISEIS